MNKLVFHFDINGTITLFDSEESDSEVDNTNMVISKSAYGKVINDQWIINKNWRDSTNSISYYKHLKSNHTSDYKDRSYLSTHPGHPLEVLNKFVDKLLSVPFIFLSFIKVMVTYPDAIIILRTFGGDIFKIVDHLNYIGCMSPENSPLKKGYITGIITHDKDDNIIIRLHNGYSVQNDKGVNNLFLSTTYNLALKEDYYYWHKNGRKTSHGKQLFANADMIQYFFDDHDVVNLVNKDNGLTFVHKINTLDAALDENFFIDLII